MKKLLRTLLVVLMVVCGTFALALTGCDDAPGNTETPGENSNGGNTDTPGGNGGGNTDTPGENTGNPGDTAYSIELVSEGGIIIPEATITAYKDNTQIASATTDETGVATLYMPAGVYTLEVTGLPAGYKIEDEYTTEADSDKVRIYAVSSVITDADAPSNKVYTIGDVMYDFTLTTYDDEQTLTLSELLQTKRAVVLNFWYSGCAPCKTEFPVMQRAYAAYQDMVEIIAIDNYSRENNTYIKNFVEQTMEGSLTFPFAAHTNNSTESEEIARLFGNPQQWPTTVVIDRYGVVAFKNVGSEPSEAAWRNLFAQFTADDYSQNFKPGDDENGGTVIEIQKPDVDQPESALIEAAINAEGQSFTYYQFPEDEEAQHEMIWPWLISEDGKSIYPANRTHLASYAMIYTSFEMEKDDVYAFDFEISTEETADIFYVLINNMIIAQYSGIGSTTFYYVADATGTYDVCFLYQKDTDESWATDDVKDTVLISNVRMTTLAEVNESGAVVDIMRAAAYNFDETTLTYEYVNVVYNNEDKFYHVGSKNGPLLLANLMTGTNFDPQNGAFNYTLDESVDYFGTDYDAFVTYCQAAVSSEIEYYCTVNYELGEILKRFVAKAGIGNENEWLELCYYFSHYGAGEGIDGPERNPIKGLTIDAAFEAKVGEPNEVTFNRAITANYGHVYHKITVSRSGVYKIHSKRATETQATEDTQAMLYDEDGRSLSMSNDWYNPATGYSEVQFTLFSYLEAGKTYYLASGFQWRGELGTYTFYIDYEDQNYYEWSLAVGDESGFYYTLESETSSRLRIIAQNVVLHTDGYYHVKNFDGSVGSLVWLDFTQLAGPDSATLESMINRGYFRNIATPAKNAQGEYYQEAAFDEDGYELYYGFAKNEDGTYSDSEKAYIYKDGNFFYYSADKNNPDKSKINPALALPDRVYNLAYEKDNDGKIIYTDYTEMMKDYLAEAKKTNGYLKVTEELANILNIVRYNKDDELILNCVNGEIAWMLFGTYYYRAYTATGTENYPTTPYDEEKIPIPEV